MVVRTFLSGGGVGNSCTYRRMLPPVVDAGHLLGWEGNRGVGGGGGGLTNCYDEDQIL